MSEVSLKRWREASEIALRAMGVDRAEADPLAYWCLTEWIYDYGQRAMRAKSNS